MKTKPKKSKEKLESLNSWDIHTDELVNDKVILALSRAYGYKGKDPLKASDVLCKNKWELIPW